MAANRGYDVVVDVDAQGDLGHTDLQDDLEFHSTNYDDQQPGAKIQPDASAGFLPGPANRGAASAPVGKRLLWTISFYAQFFDVDTNEVLRRCYAAIFPRANFLDVLDGNPDLYGPVWIATTVVVILFISGTFNEYLKWQNKDHFPYDFRLLSGGAGLIYGYTAIIPVGLWATLRWFGSESANLLECWALYGYANIIWIPVAVISWSPINLLNFIFVGIGFVISAIFLFRNLYPVLSATDVRTSKVLLIVVVVLHAALAVAISVLFFAHSSPLVGHDGDKTKPIGGAPSGAPTSTPTSTPTSVPKGDKGDKKGDSMLSLLF